MRKLIFRCTFLTDVVLNATAATEGNNTSLDYVPGANFLGIVARKYNEFKEDAYIVFHSGLVRFGDAHISNNEQRSYKMPASYFVEKGLKLGGDDIAIFINDKISEKTKDEYRSAGRQLKQQRSGYFIENDNKATLQKISKDFALKSAYDRVTRKSKEGQIFGYESLPAQTEWIFAVEIEEEADHLVEAIKQGLQGNQRVGRSKTAQYGLVKIEFLKEEGLAEKIPDSVTNSISIYADSCLAFINVAGQPTLTPSAEDLGFPGAKINWEKSQVITRVFAPWNQKRYVREADRICIDKGSVLILESVDIDQINPKLLQKGIGCFTNEGYGKVLINPGFLETDTDGRAKIKFEMAGQDRSDATVQTDEYGFVILEKNNNFSDDPVYNFLFESYEAGLNEQKILKKVGVFVSNHASKYKNIKPSQWGGIRERATRAKDYADLVKLLFHEDRVDGRDNSQGYLTHGISKDDWSERKRLDTLKKEIEAVYKSGLDVPVFTALLAAAMAKKNK